MCLSHHWLCPLCGTLSCSTDGCDIISKRYRENVVTKGINDSRGTMVYDGAILYNTVPRMNGGEGGRGGGEARCSKCEIMLSIYMYFFFLFFFSIPATKSIYFTYEYMYWEKFRLFFTQFFYS